MAKLEPEQRTLDNRFESFFDVVVQKLRPTKRAINGARLAAVRNMPKYHEISRVVQNRLANTDADSQECMATWMFVDAVMKDAPFLYTPLLGLRLPDLVEHHMPWTGDAPTDRWYEELVLSWKRLLPHQQWSDVVKRMRQAQGEKQLLKEMQRSGEAADGEAVADKAASATAPTTSMIHEYQSIMRAFRDAVDSGVVVPGYDTDAVNNDKATDDVGQEDQSAMAESGAAAENQLPSMIHPVQPEKPAAQKLLEQVEARENGGVKAEGAATRYLAHSDDDDDDDSDVEYIPQAKEGAYRAVAAVGGADTDRSNATSSYTNPMARKATSAIQSSAVGAAPTTVQPQPDTTVEDDSSKQQRKAGAVSSGSAAARVREARKRPRRADDDF